MSAEVKYLGVKGCMRLIIVVRKIIIVPYDYSAFSIPLIVIESIISEYRSKTAEHDDGPLKAADFGFKTVDTVDRYDYEEEDELEKKVKKKGEEEEEGEGALSEAPEASEQEELGPREQELQHESSGGGGGAPEGDAPEASAGGGASASLSA